MANDEPDFVALMDRIAAAIKAAGCDAEKDPEAAALIGRREAEAIGQQTGYWITFEVRDAKLYVIPPWRFEFG